MMKTESVDFEKSLVELKEILDSVSDENSSIDENLKLYEKAQKIIKELSDALNNAKEKVEKIIQKY